MTNFKEYANYYNLLYKDKDYQSEVDYIEGLIREYASGSTIEMLDLGCGTGRHDELFVQKGYKVTGVDLSEQMIAIAKSSRGQNMQYIVDDVRTVLLDKQFDVLVSLFHVASYQTTNNDFEQYLQTAYTHLKPGGIFIFDFWYGPAVLTDLPQNKCKKVEDELLLIERFTEPLFRPNENIVDVTFNVIVENKRQATIQKTKELHSMRYWFLPELHAIIAKNNFSTLCQYKWMTKDDLGFDSWYGVMVVRK